jgi:hypothetical protein
MARDAVRGWPRRLIHIAALIGGWFVFFYWWYVVAVQHWNKTLIALIILVTLLVAPAITIAWVSHNLNLFRRKGPRLGVPKVAMEYARDWKGREVVADWKGLAEADFMVVTVEGDQKRYSASKLPPADG